MKGLTRLIGEKGGYLHIDPGPMPDTIVVQCAAAKTDDGYKVTKEAVVCLCPDTGLNEKFLLESVKWVISEVEQSLSFLKS